MNNKLEKITVHVDNKDTQRQLVNGLNKCLKNWKEYSDIVLVCIGTDRSTGDSLGPLVGDFIYDNVKQMKVYGNLENPVHALTLHDTLKEIEDKYENPLVIAIDACLGGTENVGQITLMNKPIKPGAAVKKDLPPVGEYSIRAFVNVGGFMEMLVLQNTRLSLVMKMAKKIANSIIEVDQNLQKGSKTKVDSEYDDLYEFC